METKNNICVRTDLKAGQAEMGPGMYPPQQYGWWWMPGGFIARPGRPTKAFTGWWFGPAPTFYYPAGYGSGSGGGFGVAGAQNGGGVTEGMTAPDQP